jgi:hypothetical protein
MTAMILRRLLLLSILLSLTACGLSRDIQSKRYSQLPSLKLCYLLYDKPMWKEKWILEELNKRGENCDQYAEKVMRMKAVNDTRRDAANAKLRRNLNKVFDDMKSRQLEDRVSDLEWCAKGLKAYCN